jgi:hypothetical protein
MTRLHTPPVLGPALYAAALLLSANLAEAKAPVDLNKLVGQRVDIAPSAYVYRSDRTPKQNPAESWIGLIQYAGLPYDKPVDVNAPEVRKVLCGLLWEEVRPVRQVELSWPPGDKGQPSADSIALRYFDATDGTSDVLRHRRRHRGHGSDHKLLSRLGGRTIPKRKSRIGYGLSLHTLPRNTPDVAGYGLHLRGNSTARRHPSSQE